MRSRWVGLACVGLAVVLSVAATSSAAAAAGRPHTHTHPLIATHPLSGAHPAATRPLLGGHAPVITPTISFNWSGYDDSTDGPFTSVTATWTQPSVRFAGTASFTDAAFWVGLDGDNSDTVEQIGTEGYSEGAVGYDAWYEMYPAAPVTIDMAIHPGDVLTGTVAWSSPASFTLTLVNHTTGRSFSAVRAMSTPPVLASAEVIAEAPSTSSDVVPLADFGAVRFTDCALDGQPLSSFDLNRIDMASDYYSDSAVALAARTLALGADGASFAVTTDVTPPTTTVSGAGRSWRDQPVTLRFHATDPSGGQGLDYTEYSLDGGTTWTRGVAVTIPAPADHSGDGAHKVLYRSADKAGNVEKSRSVTVGVDTRAPTPVADWKAVARRGGTAVLRYRIADPRPGSPTATVTIRVRDTRGQLVRKVVLAGRHVNRTLAWRFVSTMPSGTYLFAVSATDAAGNPQTAVATSTLVVR